MTPYLELGGDYREVLDGVFLVELPLPYSLGLVNVYLVRSGDAWLLVDCGMDTEACLEALSRAVEGVGIKWRAIRRILLTHTHPDHAGLCPKLLERTGAQLIMHAQECHVDREWIEEALPAAGVPADIQQEMHGVFETFRKQFPKLKPDVLLAGGETIECDAGPLLAIWTPGHSPGHVCLYSERLRLLFAGDHIIEHISPNISLQKGRDALGDYLESLKTVARLDLHLLLPAHGAPFRGHREWIERTVTHHAQRCEQLVAAISRGAKTAHELVGVLWNRVLSPFHYRFAIFEVLAHLEHLRAQGRVRAERDTVVRWRPSTEAPPSGNTGFGV